jgi:hypothetical protein
MPGQRKTVGAVATLLVSAALVVVNGSGQAGEWEPRREFARVPSEEEPVERELRHERVARRRQGPIVIVHRGAAAFAPENTLEAYAAAMDYGADGCEVDLRRTRDGVLVLFHDDMLDRLTDGLGTVRQVTYRELLDLRAQEAFGRAMGGTPPTFGALLDLARRRGMLLHLDVKEPGLEEEIAQLLDTVDAWDHVVSINEANAANLRRHPKLQLLRYKGPGLFEGRQDVDPQAVGAQLAQPGEMVIVDDPRVAARILRREPYVPGLLFKNYRLVLRAEAEPPPSDTSLFNAAAHLRLLAKRVKPDSPKALMDLLAAELPAGQQPEGDAANLEQRTARIVERAWAAQRLGALGRKTKRTVDLLERTVQRRSLHPDWLYHGLDGALASRALGKLGATESVRVLVAALRRVDPELRQIANPQLAKYPLSWNDFRAKMYVMWALGDLRCNAAKTSLQEYIALPEAAATELGPPQFEEATRALLRQRLTRKEIVALLRHPNSAVRGTAILECVDHPTEERRSALREGAAWALELPSRRR